MKPTAAKPTAAKPSAVKPTPEQLAAAQDTTIDDVIGPDLRVLFCGINPGLWSGATGHHFARPGNRFWPALHRGGFTPRQLRPQEQGELLELGLGITNVVARTTAKADELTAEEYRAGGKALAARVERWRPRALAILGIGAFRAAFGRPGATVGPQDLVLGEGRSDGRGTGGTGDTRVWLLPNPSGLNAHYTLDAIAAEFRRLREAVDS